MPAELPRPARQSPRPGLGIVHLGVGAFFKAFGAVWIQEVLETQGGDWGVLGISLRTPGQRDALKPQDWVYHAVEMGPDGPTPRRIEVLRDVLVAPEDPGAVLDALCDPAVRIVSLTITEKGYCHHPATGKLNRDHPEIVHDLTEAGAAAPQSALGYIVRALALRRAAGTRPFTVLCCDNLPGNGALLRRLVLDFASALDPDLADWIAAEGRFPSTMVDRIVPATKPEDLAAVAELTGTDDRGAVVHEPFRQWAVEDDFVDADRPDFAAVGAQMVADVEPFELMKLRCLNGTHSTLAYLGYLSGHRTIAEAVADPVLNRFVRHLWNSEIIPSLAPPPGEDLGAYCDALLARYENPNIRHLTWQIAMDGSQKLPQRLVGTIGDNLSGARPVAGLALAVAAWMRYVGGVDDAGEAIEVKDPLADRLRALHDGAEDADGRVAALLSVREVFPQTLATHEGFRDAVTTGYRRIAANGARAAMEETLT